jgi:TRAP-type uncharacterized transport system substrate-binding protein
MTKLSIGILAAALTVGVVGTPVFDGYELGFGFQEAEARGARKTSSSGSSGFSRTTVRSSGGNKKSGGMSFFGGNKKSKSGTVTTSGKGGGSSKTKTLTTKQKKATFAALPKQKQQRMGKQVIKAQRTKFKKPAVMPGRVSATTPPSKRRNVYRNTYKSNPVYNRAGRYDSSTYYQRRNDRYGKWNNNPPIYVTNSSPSFGMWDAMALYWMVDMMTPDQSAAFAYNQQNNADWQQAQEQMREQARTNGELQAKLDAMDAQMKTISGDPDPNFIPSGVDADLMLSSEAVDSTRPDFKMCVGDETGTYFRAAALMSSSISKVNIVPEQTRGSGEALAHVSKDICDGAFVQADAYWNYRERNNGALLPFEVVMNPFKETVHLVCHDDGPTELSDLTSDKYSIWFPNGSGAAETWDNFVGENSDFESVNTIWNNKDVRINSYQEAMLKAEQDQNACFMYVGAKGSGKFLHSVEASAKKTGMVLIGLDDNEILDSKDPSSRTIYTSTEIGENTYPLLMRNESAWFSEGSIDSFTVESDIIITDKWKRANPNLYSSLVTEMRSVQPDLDTMLRQ